MSEMIERVAKAIDHASQPPGQPDYKILMENAARAAIEAMRNPTMAMLRKGDAVFDDRSYDRSDELREAWQAMIDAALGQGAVK